MRPAARIFGASRNTGDMSSAQTKLDAWLASWPSRLEERDKAFMRRLDAEIGALDVLGYDRREMLAALSGRLYVRKWTACPRWMEYAERLPLPLKWRDGITYRRTKCGAVKALIYGDALFIQYKDCCPVGERGDVPHVLIVHDLRQRTLPELVDGLPNGEAIDWALIQLARENGLRLGSLTGILR
jgi:hypothetical protein